MLQFLIILSLGRVTYQQVTSSPQQQPETLKYVNMSRCCTYVESTKAKYVDLLSCTNDTAYSLSELVAKEGGIILVSYSTSSIMEYGAYSYFINAAYAEQNGYGMVLMSPETGSQYEPQDQRWNKVYILLNLIDPKKGMARKSDYVVWLDSDLIMLDFSMNISEITRENKQYDIIISRDPRIENGIANSGFFIVKNSDWSKEFLQSWWNSYDRITGMDQHVFSRLWDSGQPDITNHIMLLRPDALNTDFPAWEKQQPYNQILHLAGVSTIFRKITFEKASKEICRAYSYQQTHLQEKDNLKSKENTIIQNKTNDTKQKNTLLLQLGITREILQEIESFLPRESYMQQILVEMRSKERKYLTVNEIQQVIANFVSHIISLYI